MYITGLSWITACGSGTGNSSNTFNFTRGKLTDISGKKFPIHPAFRKGRLDRFSLLGLQAAANALDDAGLYEKGIKPKTGIVASTIYGCLKTDLDFYESVNQENGNLPEPNLFTHTLSNIFLGYAAMLFGITGPNYVLYEKSSSSVSSLVSAMESIELGETDTMLAGVCDIEPPEGFEGAENVIPGALFAVIEKSPDEERKKFGRLSMDSKRNILLNKIVINDMAMCVKECLKMKNY